MRVERAHQRAVGERRARAEHVADGASKWAERRLEQIARVRLDGGDRDSGTTPTSGIDPGDAVGEAYVRQRDRRRCVAAKSARALAALSGKLQR